MAIIYGLPLLKERALKLRVFLAQATDMHGGDEAGAPGFVSALRPIELAVLAPCRVDQADSRMAGRDSGQGFFLAALRYDQGGVSMKVSPASDIVGIASAFGIARHQYKEIKRDEDAYEIADRWPMLAELHGLVSVAADGNALKAAGTEATASVSGTSRQSTGLKVVSATSQNADAGCSPPSAPEQIAA